MNNALVKEILLLTGITLICFLSVWLFTRPAISSIFILNNFGPIGDTIGGITAPIIGGIGAYLVYKSFRAQEKANKFQFDALIDQKRIDALSNIYHEFSQDCKEVVEKIESNPNGIDAYNNLHLILTEALGNGEYKAETLRNIKALRSLTFHIWSFYDSLTIKYGDKPYGERIEDISIFILINKFLNAYETHVEHIFSRIVDSDLSSSEGHALVFDLKGAQTHVKELRKLVTYSS